MPSPEVYPIYRLQAADVLAPEEMGSKRKGWVRLGDDTEPWLFKYSRVNEGLATGEAWAEKIAAEVAALIELPAARVEFASMDGAIGCVSRQFPELSIEGVELVHGSDLLPGVVLGYDRNKRFLQADHTLESILDAVASVIPAGVRREEAFQCLAGFVVLDALVLNTDRHHENWALFRKRGPDGVPLHTVAPTYDHASSLARNESGEKLERWLAEKSLNRAAWYALRGHGGVFLKGEKRGTNPVRLVQVAARRWPSYFQPWLDRLSKIDFSAFESIVRCVPTEVMSTLHCEFALALLRHTHQTLVDFQ